MRGVIEGGVGLPPDLDCSCEDELVLAVSREEWHEFTELDGERGPGDPSHGALGLGLELKNCSEKTSQEASVEPASSSRPLKRKREEGQLEAIFYRDPILERPFKRRKGGRAYARPLYLSARVRSVNSRIQLPELGQRCGFCGACHHTFGFGLKAVACPYAKAVLQHDGTLRVHQRCTYKRCLIQHLHYTRVCPTLHSICPVCGIRGHQGNCAMNIHWLTSALADFEAVADQGVFTARRHQEPAWGFFPSAGTAEEASYQDLLKMDVVRAYDYCTTLCPNRILRVKLWGRTHRNSPRCASNRPEHYVLVPWK